MNSLPLDLDLNLLRVLVQVHADRKVSLAAEHLGMSQPAVSSALKRLREALGDRLFVPTARGMQATPLTDEIAPQIAADRRGAGQHRRDHGVQGQLRCRDQSAPVRDGDDRHRRDALPALADAHFP